MSEFMQIELPPVSTAATLDEATSPTAQLVAVTGAALQLEAILHYMAEENDMSLRSDLQERREKALAIIHSAQGIAHPDTKRLDHLIQMDHSVKWSGPAEAGNPGTVESIHFIFDGVADNKPIKNKVRAAIDLSIANQDFGYGYAQANRDLQTNAEGGGN